MNAFISPHLIRLVGQLNFCLILVLGCQAAKAFPKHLEVSVGGATTSFQLLGKAKREFFYFDIYDVAGYVHLGDAGGRQLASVNPCLEFSQFLDADDAGCFLSLVLDRMLVLDYRRDLSVEKVKEVLSREFEKNAPARLWTSLERELLAFLSLLTDDIREDDRLQLVWMRDGRFFVSRNQSVSEFQASSEFLVTLWAIWYGPEAVVAPEEMLQFINLVN